MKRDSLVLACLRRGAPLVPALLLLPLFSCVEEESVVCASGLVCAKGWTCAAQQNICIQDTCGDGFVQASEVCDDGNVIDGDGCNAKCLSTELCGNHVQDFNEACDDGNTVSGDGCSGNCLFVEGCGNGQLDEGEPCDDGNSEDDDDCIKRQSSCILAFCGDGIVKTQGANIEQCDDGAETASCNLNCTKAWCGDSIVNMHAGEACDPPGPHPGFTCNDQCHIASCGNGVPEAVLGEECDDGNDSNEDDCLITCRRNTCGDGYVDPATELCDDGNTVTEDSCAYGTPTCQHCSADCRTPLALTGAFCGDGTTNGNEACDDGNADSCGTCSADCGRPLEQAASGQIQAVPAVDITPGELIYISDGGRTAILEFNEVEKHGPFYECIPLADSMGAVAVAKIIKAAIDTFHLTGLNITASRSGASVVLTNNGIGTFGNQLMTHGGPSDHVKLGLSGMSGGQGRNCPAGTGCTRDEDCAPELACHNNRCEHTFLDAYTQPDSASRQPSSGMPQP